MNHIQWLAESGFGIRVCNGKYICYHEDLDIYIEDADAYLAIDGAKTALEKLSRVKSAPVIDKINADLERGALNSEAFRIIQDAVANYAFVAPIDGIVFGRIMDILDGLNNNLSMDVVHHKPDAVNRDLSRAEIHTSERRKERI